MTGDIPEAVVDVTKLWNEAADSTGGELHPIRNHFIKKVRAYDRNAAWHFQPLSSDPGASGEHIQLEWVDPTAPWVLQLPTNRGLGSITAEDGKSFMFAHWDVPAVDTSRLNAHSQLPNPGDLVGRYSMLRPGSRDAIDAVARASSVVRVQRLIRPRVVGPSNHPSPELYSLNGWVALSPVINRHVQSMLEQWTKVVQPGTVRPAEAVEQLRKSLGAPVEHIPQLRVLAVGAGVNGLVWLLPDSMRPPAWLASNAYRCTAPGLSGPPSSGGSVAVEQIMLPAVACYERTRDRVQLWLVARGEYAVQDELIRPAGGVTSTAPTRTARQTPSAARTERSIGVAYIGGGETPRPQASRGHDTSSGVGQARVPVDPKSPIGITIQALVDAWNEAEDGLTRQQVEHEVSRPAGEPLGVRRPSVAHRTKYVGGAQVQWLEVTFQTGREELCAVLPLSRRLEKAVAERLFRDDAEVRFGNPVASVLEISRLVQPMLKSRATGGRLAERWRQHPGLAEFRDGTPASHRERPGDAYSTLGERPPEEPDYRPVGVSDLVPAQRDRRGSRAPQQSETASLLPDSAPFRSGSSRRGVSKRSEPEPVARVRSDLLSAWRGDWQGPFSPVAKIKKTLLGVAGVTEVFKSAELGALVCRLSDGTAVALPSKRDYANNRTCYQTEATPSVTSRLTDVTKMAEVTPDGQAVVKLGVAVVSAD